MATVQVKLANGRVLDFFGIHAGLPGPARFALGVRKSGSTLMIKLIEALAKANDTPVVDVGGALYSRNLTIPEWQTDTALCQIIRPGHVYTTFRDMPIGFLGNKMFMQGPKLLMVRDPRDALVSEYFFFKSFENPVSEEQDPRQAGAAAQFTSGRETARSLDIDEYVLSRARAMSNTLARYEPVAKLPSTRVYRYEEWIFEKERLLRSIAEHFGWVAEDRTVAQILKWADQRPSAENPKAFVRRVTPGDHREKLKPQTIAKLNELVRPAMELYGYPIDSVLVPATAAAAAPDPAATHVAAKSADESVSARRHLRFRRERPAPGG